MKSNRTFFVVVENTTSCTQTKILKDLIDNSHTYSDTGKDNR